MAGNILSANIRSNKPPIPPAPSQVASTVTREPSASGATVQRDTYEDSWSRSDRPPESSSTLRR